MNSPLSLTPAGRLRFDSVRRAVRAAAPGSILEIGAGEGALGEWLARQGSYTGIEPDSVSFRLLERRLAACRNATALCTDDRDANLEPVDLVCAFEVLEHLPDDASALERWRRLVVPGGALLVSVPRGPERYNAWDEYVGHLRRYSRQDLHGVLERAGFAVVSIESYGVVVGDVLERIRSWIARRRLAGAGSLDERTGRSGRLLRSDGVLAATAAALLAAPGRMIQIPFRSSEVGTGLVALARVAQ